MATRNRSPEVIALLMNVHRELAARRRGARPLVKRSQDPSTSVDNSFPGERKEFLFSSTTEVGRVAEYLMRIAEGLRLGRVSLSAPGRMVRLEPAQVVRLELGAQSNPEEGKASLELEISWEPVRN